MMRRRGPPGRRRVAPLASSFHFNMLLLVLSMFSSMAAVYVASQLWQAAETRTHLVNELKKQSKQVNSLSLSTITVDDNLKIGKCREQLMKLAALEAELEKAKKEGYVPQVRSTKKKLLAVVGIMTTFGRKNNREAIRKEWIPRGSAFRNLEEERGIILRFVIGRSVNRGDYLDKDIDNENKKAGDFMIFNDVTEVPGSRIEKVKLFFASAVERWDAEFYVKANDDIYVNIDALGAMLTSHLDKARIYLGCMISGEVYSQPSNPWYEREWWKFGEKGTKYFRYANGELYAISRALAYFISINRSILGTYDNEDVTVGSWLIGTDVEHIGDLKFCCYASPPESICLPRSL